jgi:formylmethanofuran dehydrogenase subunit A
MRLMICFSAALALAGCSKQSEAPPADNAANDVAATAPAATPAAFDIKGTSWEFTDSKTNKPIQESIDENGNYISQLGTEHVDHGTAMMKDGKACFTSAMTKDGEICWTNPNVDIGQSGETTNDKGDKLTVKRVAYVPLTMPK